MTGCLRNATALTSARVDFFQSKMAGGAAVSDLLLGNPYLLNAALEVALQGDGIRAATDEM